MEVCIEDISEIRKHAEELYEAGTSPTHDFDGRANKRSKEKFVNDRIEGKVGELAVANLLRELGYECKVDYDIYDSIEETDDGDLKTIQGAPPKTEFDVKTTKERNLWLAVRESIYKQHEPDDPIILVTVPADEVTSPPFTANVIGWVEKRDFDTRLARGERMFLPWNPDKKIGPPLKTDNWVIPVDDVPEASREDWRRLVEERLT